MQLGKDMVKKKKKIFSTFRKLARGAMLITFNLTLDSSIINEKFKNHHKN